MSLHLLGVAQMPSIGRPVRIDALTRNNCAIEADELPEEDGFDLWIGAVGPIRSCVSERLAERAVINFETPLDSEVLLHFLAQ